MVVSSFAKRHQPEKRRIGEEESCDALDPGVFLP